MVIGTEIRLGNMVISEEAYRVWVDDQPVQLTYVEFELLATLARNRGRVLSQRQLLESVWGWEGTGRTRRLAVHIFRLRRKIAESFPFAIRTVAKRGYALADVRLQADKR